MHSGFLHRRWRAGIFTALCGVALIAAPAGAEVVVIVNKAGPDSLTKEQVADIFLGRTTTLPGGAGTAPQDLPESNALRDEFYSKVTGKSAALAKSHWSKMAFTGKGTPPREGSSADVKKAVAATPGGIGYVEKAVADSSVKAVLTIN